MGLDKYFTDIKDKLNEGTEHTLRTPLENLLNEVATQWEPKIEVTHEPSNQQDKGRPDFRVSKSGLTIGYIETKAHKLGVLDEALESQQIKNYASISKNIILSDYAEFILIREGKPVMREVLFYKGDKKLDAGRKVRIEELFKTFFTFQVEAVAKPEKLSALLAKRTKLFKQYLLEQLNSDNDSPFLRRLKGEKGLFDLFKETLIADLTMDEFADIYAQTITYGLFMARLEAEGGKISRKNAFEFIPSSLGVIQEMFESMRPAQIPDEIAWVVDEIVDVLNNLSDGFQNEMSFGKVIKEGEETEDPYIYFYENFLADYDREKRKAKGVYYTPVPVVQFITSSIEKILQRDFGATGFKDGKVNVLDFACGTGTFLLEAIKRAVATVDKSSRASLIKSHILNDFYGFEYLVAPYTVAHLKLSKFLEYEGYKLDKAKDERLKVYLTDTLDDQKHKENNIFPSISKEGADANKVKTGEPILVVMGNPPYSNYSRNNKPFILELIKAYKQGLNEKKTNLNDDYIKFIRYAQCKIEGQKYSYEKPGAKGHAPFEGQIASFGKGVVGIITNNSYLDGITHRMMRKSLYETFDKVYVLNLHGNSIKGEGDKNVFDIMVGVTVALFVKLDRPLKEKEVYYFSTLASGINARDDKYRLLRENNISTIEWTKLKPKGPDFWFVPKDLGLEHEYNEGLKLSEIFKEYGNGIKTDRDDLFIDKDAAILTQRLKALLGGKYDSNFCMKFRVVDSSSYSLIERIKGRSFSPSNIKLIEYRPFDRRFIYYENGLTSRPAYEIMKNIIYNDSNISILSKRQFKKESFSYVYCTDIISESSVFESTFANNSIFPLYLYPDKPKDGLYDRGGGEQARLANFTPGFLEYIKELEARYGMMYVPDGKGTLLPSPFGRRTEDEGVLKGLASLVKGGGRRPEGSEDVNPPTPLPKGGKEDGHPMKTSAPTFGPEDILGYIYAILHSNLYRQRYFEFLKIDFPRVPFFDAQVFAALSWFGSELIQHHLLKVPYNIPPSKADKGTPKVEHVRHEKATNRLYINNEYYFEDIGEDVWEFEIGGYQVLSKYLKERKGMELDWQEVDKVKSIAMSLHETIRIMAQIDQVLGEANVFGPA